MSEDVTTTPEGDAIEQEKSVVPSAKPKPLKGVDVPEELQWVLDPEQALDGVKKLKEKSETRLKEIEQLQREKTQLQQQVDAVKEAELKEKEQYKELYESLKPKQDTMRIDNAILTELPSFSFVSAKQVLQLVDRSQIKLHEDGVVGGVKEALQALADENPNLIQQSKAPPLPVQKPTNPATETKAKLTKDDLKGKSPQWVISHMDEVEAMLKELK